MVKVNVISGFLGAGKTTLIRKLLTGRLRNEKVVLLENEYGEIGIDGGFMKDVGITVTELNAGCICCTLAGDFQAAVDQLIDTYHPDRILVEPTGVGKLSEILAAVEKAKERHPEIETGGSATVVDAGKCRMYMKNFGEFFLDQVKSASTVIFSRTQLLDADRVEKSRLLIACDTRDWDGRAEQRCIGVTEKPCRGTCLGEQGSGDIEKLQKLLVPRERVNVEKQRACRVGYVGGVHLTACQTIDKEAIHRAEAKLAALGARAKPLVVIQHPLKLGGGEVRVNGKSRFLADHRFKSLCAQLVAILCRAAALPDDGGANGLARFSIPQDGGLALIGDADGSDILGGEPRLQ